MVVQSDNQISKSGKRYNLVDIQYPSLWEFYKRQRDAFWVPAEIDLTDDYTDWNEKLTDNDRHFLTYTLSFFSQADGIVLQNLNANFSLDIDIPEVIAFYGIQQGIEAIHWETYADLIRTFIKDREERERASNAIQNYPCVAEKAAWMMKWMDADKVPFIERLVGFACSEGIFFSSAFASIYYYKQRDVLPGLMKSNQLIARDEGLHRDFACELFKILTRESPDEYPLDWDIISEIVRDAVKIEETFVKESLNVDLVGINPNNMIQYVQYTANQLMTVLGYKGSKLYNVKNPFDWMDFINLPNKENFFDVPGQVAEYKKPDTQAKDNTFELDDDF